MKPPLSRILTLFACAGLAGCSVGAVQRPPPNTPSAAAAAANEVQYVTPRKLAKEPVGTPGHTVLEFWQDIQFQDFSDALTLLTPTFIVKYGHGLDHFATDVSAEQARWSTLPRIVLATSTGNSGRVVIEFLYGGTPTVTVFNVQRTGARWLISYNFYLVHRLATPTPSITSGSARTTSSTSSSSRKP